MPAGFESDGIPNELLIPPPPEWEGETQVLPIDGAPAFGEIVMLHRPSHTLIVGDLLFNFSRGSGVWTEVLLTLGTIAGKHGPGVSRPYKLAIDDMEAFSASVRTILDWDFDRIIVGHGVMISTGGKEKMRDALKTAGIGEI